VFVSTRISYVDTHYHVLFFAHLFASTTQIDTLYLIFYSGIAGAIFAGTCLLTCLIVLFVFMLICLLSCLLSVPLLVVQLTHGVVSMLVLAVMFGIAFGLNGN